MEGEDSTEQLAALKLGKKKPSLQASPTVVLDESPKRQLLLDSSPDSYPKKRL